LIQVLLVIRQLRGAHTRANQAKIIIEVIKEYSLENRIRYFITDNATNNNTAVRLVLDELCPHLTAKQKKARRLRCLGHVINLAAKAFLYSREFDAFEKDIEAVVKKSDLLKELQLWRTRGPVRRLHNIIVFICRTPQRREEFAAIKDIPREHSDYDHLSLRSDNATRWNSLYLMIKRAIKLKSRIDLFCLENHEEVHRTIAKKTNVSPAKRENLLSNNILTSDD